MYLVMLKISLETLLSSEYSLTVDEISDEGSLTNNINKTGPRTVPWCRDVVHPHEFGDFELTRIEHVKISMYQLAQSCFIPVGSGHPSQFSDCRALKTVPLSEM